MAAAAPRLKPRAAPRLSSGRGLRVPGGAQGHRAVEDGTSRGVLGEIGDEIAVPLELEALLGRRLRERRLDVRRDDALRVRVEIVEEAALALVRLVVVSGDDRRCTGIGRAAALACAVDNQWMLPFTLRASAPAEPLRVAASYVQCTAVTLPLASFSTPVQRTI